MANSSELCKLLSLFLSFLFRLGIDMPQARFHIYRNLGRLYINRVVIEQHFLSKYTQILGQKQFAYDWLI